MAHTFDTFAQKALSIHFWTVIISNYSTEASFSRKDKYAALVMLSLRLEYGKEDTAAAI